MNNTINNTNNNNNTTKNNTSDTIQPILKVENVTKSYTSGEEALIVLRDISLQIQFGEVISVIGESGSGKSTLLNVLGGLDSVDKGTIVYNNKWNITSASEDDLTHYRNQEIGFVFQLHNLLPDFSAIENIMLPFLAHQYNLNAARKRALQLLEDVGLAKRADHRPNQLSGGELQRIAIARSLVNHPKLILADEPTGNLDEKNTDMVQQLLWNLREKYQITLVLVTHNTELAGRADRSLKLVHGTLENK